MTRWLVAVLFIFSAVADELDWGFYTLHNWTETPYGWTGALTFEATSTPGYDTPISPLNLSVFYVDEFTLRLKIVDPSTSRWEVPNIVTIPDTTTAFAPQSYRVRTSQWYEPFSITIERTSGEVVFNSNYLYFSDHYLQFGTYLNPTAHIYGLGERVWSFHFDRSQTQTFSFLTSDQGTPTKLPLYGSYPYFLNVDQGLASGAFLLNSNIMDVEVSSSGLKFKTTGGILDTYIFLGPTPEKVTQQFHQLVGNPFLPPLWGLGYHQCRWGYANLSYLQTVVEQFVANQIPADTFWVDIDYMEKWKVWTTDPVLWPNQTFGDFIRSIHDQNYHFIPIVDPGVYIADNYSVYLDGINRNVFIRDPPGTGFHVGKVWPGRVHFPDWTHPNASAYWTDWIQTFWDVIPVDGLWIDMNEVASFCDGRCYLPESEDNLDVPDGLFKCNCTTDLRYNNTLQWDEPPYIPVDVRNRLCRTITGDIHGGLDISTLSMASQWYGGIEYNLHNLYGHLEGVITTQALAQIRQKRPFVISRSTFPGSSRNVGHWLGDNVATWNDLRVSVAGILQMSILGMPLVGADVCGFGGNTTLELCQRWMTLGAFYPFYRNHNIQGANGQEPYAMGPDLLQTSLNILRTRYALLPYLYTLFYLTHISGGAVARPLVYEFPNDASTYTIDEQFLFGPYLLISPVLQQGSTTVIAYFPRDEDWYDYWTGQQTVAWNSTQRRLELATPVNTIQVHVRSGSIIPIQTPALTTQAQRGNPYQLVIAIRQNPVDGLLAHGSLYIDDGDSLDSVATNTSLLLHFDVTPLSFPVGSFRLVSTIEKNGYDVARDFTIDEITIRGVPCTGCLSVNNKETTVRFQGSLLNISSLSLKLGTPFEVVYHCGCNDNASSSSGLSNGATAGITIAVILVVIVLGVFAWRVLKGRNQSEKLLPDL